MVVKNGCSALLVSFGVLAILAGCSSCTVTTSTENQSIDQTHDREQDRAPRDRREEAEGRFESFVFRATWASQRFQGMQSLHSSLTDA